MTHSSGNTCTHHTWNYSFIIKYTNQGKPNGDIPRERSGRVPSIKLPCPRTRYPATLICNYHQGNSSRPWCPEFLLEFYYIGMINWIIGHMVNQSAAPLSSMRSDWSHVAQSPNPLITWMAFLFFPFLPSFLSSFFLFYFQIYLFERGREKERESGEGAEGENLRQAPHWAQSPRQGSILPSMTWPEPKPRVGRLIYWATQAPFK